MCWHSRCAGRGASLYNSVLSQRLRWVIRSAPRANIDAHTRTAASARSGQKEARSSVQRNEIMREELGSLCYSAERKIRISSEASPLSSSRPHVTRQGTMILASIRLFSLFSLFTFVLYILKRRWFVDCAMDGINNLRLKFFYYLNWYTLWMIINSRNHSTRSQKTNALAALCYLAQDSFSFTLLGLAGAEITFGDRSDVLLKLFLKITVGFLMFMLKTVNKMTKRYFFLEAQDDDRRQTWIVEKDKKLFLDEILTNSSPIKFSFFSTFFCFSSSAAFNQSWIFIRKNFLNH